MRMHLVYALYSICWCVHIIIVIVTKTAKVATTTATIITTYMAIASAITSSIDIPIDVYVNRFEVDSMGFVYT